MKAKTIKGVLRKKVDEWAASISDEAVRALVKRDTIITGGCIASMLLREPVNDFDVYFRTKDTAVAVAEYYVKRFSPAKKAGIECKMYVDKDRDDRVSVFVKSAGIASEDGTDVPYQYFEGAGEGESAEYVAAIMEETITPPDAAEAIAKHSDDGKDRYRPVFVSTNAITLSDKVQIVLRFFGEPEEIHKNYDYVHCTNYWSAHDGFLKLRPEALEALLTRELRYVGSKYPIASVIRMRKFIARGWTINAGQILKMVWQIGELDLKNVDVLRDQLTGVDVAYFAELIAKIKERDSEKVNSAYLIEIIDRMF